MSVYVFVGPSLPVTQAREILDAVYLPPVAMGDIYRLMKMEPKAIGVIDGFFQRMPAVWHKEILFALTQGVRVFGASSMGALRAAELHTFGMVGVGRIFEAYRDGVFDDDDEVALIHGPAEFDYRPLSEAMVNVRHGLRQAEDAGRITQGTHRALLSAAKQMVYPDRSWPSIFERGRALGLPGGELKALDEFVQKNRPNLKREDAVELLQVMASQIAGGLTPHPPSFDFHQTYFWPRMARSVDDYHAACGIVNGAKGLRCDGVCGAGVVLLGEQLTEPAHEAVVPASIRRRAPAPQHRRPARSRDGTGRTSRAPPRR